MHRPTRRAILVGAASIAAAPAWADRPPARVFVGTFTMRPGAFIPPEFGSRAGWSEGVYSFAFDPRRGVAGPISLAAEAGNPANLIQHPNRRLLYVCHGQDTAQSGQNLISAYQVQGDRLRFLNTVRSGGGGPTHGEVDRSGRNLLTTNFATSSVVSFRLDENGAIGARTAYLGRAETNELPPPRPPGAAVSAEEAVGRTKPHDILLSRTQRYAIAAEIETSRCAVYAFDAHSGALTPHALAPGRPGSGPRHVAWHPSHRFLYSSDELGASISVWRWRERDGQLDYLNSWPLAPPSFTGSNHAADIVVHPNGGFVYVTNRGYRALSGFRIAGGGAELIPLNDENAPYAPCWCAKFDRSGRWLVMAMQSRDEVAIFEVDARTGLVRDHARVGPIVMPTCVALT